MRKLKNVKMLLAGLVIGILLAGTTVFAAGAIGSATFNNTSVVFNGQQLDLAMPLISVVLEGETNASNYMPVRAVLEAMGYDVDWDGANNAVLVTMPDQAATLVGTWEWEYFYDWRYVFNADGTGDRGIPGVETETFTWSVSGSRLYINRDFAPVDEIQNEIWTFLIDNNRLALLSQQVHEMMFNYFRQ